MSVPTFAWAMERGAALRLSPAERLVLLYLSDKANGARVCWPGQETIERFTGLAPKTIRAAIAALVDAALVRVDKRPGIVTRYHILRPDTPVNGAGVDDSHPGKMSQGDPGKMYPTTPVNGHGVAEPDPSTFYPEPQHILPPTPVKCAPEPVYNQEKEPRKEEEPPLPPASGGSVLDQPRAWRAYPADFEAFWAVYPLRVGKRAAGLLWAGAVKRAGSAEAIMAGLAVQQFDANSQYTPHPKTWLNRDGWLDEPCRKPAMSVHDQIRRDWNLPTFLAPIIDDDEPPSLLRLVS